MEQLPNSEDYKRALLACRGRISKQQHEMLEAHYKAPNHTLTATELARAAGYGDYSVANLQYGLLGRALGERLNFAPDKRGDGSTVWTSVLADGEPNLVENGHYRWVMRPQLVEALSELPWFRK